MSKGTAADAWKSMFVIALFIFSLLVALVVAQVTQLWDWFDPLTRRLAEWPPMQPHLEMYRAGREEWRAAEAVRESIDVRELDLENRFLRLEEEQRRLKTAQNELEMERVRLERWEAELEARLQRVEEREAGVAALDDLREVYAAMRPQEAAAILQDMEPEEIASLLSDMAPRQSGPILAALSRDKAMEVSRLLGL